MPALTLPDSSPIDDSPNDPPSRSSPNPYPHPIPPRPQRHPPDTAYTHAHFDSSSPYYDRVYSPSFTAIPPQSTAFSHFGLSQASANWQSHAPFLHSNPYPPPQPQLVHKVWILDCRACGTFLTNRGMKAVLLLRPNVSLFSTDALPVNCSAYSTNPDALRPPPCRFSTAPFGSRTCECLTQTLCCHTCGVAVGYMIVIPCSRCTSSISATNRATNGHRFVFHSSEIAASERHHIPNEPGVLPVEYPSPPPPPSSPPPLTSAYPTIFHSVDVPTQRRPSAPLSSQGFQPLQTSSPSPGSDYPPSPLTGSPDLAPSPVQPSPGLTTSVIITSSRRSPRPFVQSSFSHNPGSQLLSETRGATSEPCARKLKAGDILYWHHLAKHGEIPGVTEDPRARIPNWENALRLFEQ